MERFMAGAYMGFLMIAAVQDYRRKQIDLWVFGVFGFLIAGGNVCLYIAAKEYFRLADMAAGAGIGILLLGISAASHGGIGAGDGCFFIISGLALGFWSNLIVFSFAALLCGIWCLLLLVRLRFSGKKNENLRKKTVPFIPFVLAAAVCLRIGGNA